MPKRQDYTWGAWIIGVVATFAVIERKALRNPEHGHTLTATSKRWLGVNPRKPWGVAGSILFGTALSWAAAHIIAEGDRVPQFIALRAAAKLEDLSDPDPCG